MRFWDAWSLHQIEHAENVIGSDDAVAVILKDGFGIEADGQAGFFQHEAIVGTVTHGHDLVHGDVFHLGDLVDNVGLLLGADDLAPHGSGGDPVFNFKLVGEDVVQFQLLFQVVREKCEHANN